MLRKIMKRGCKKTMSFLFYVAAAAAGGVAVYKYLDQNKAKVAVYVNHAWQTGSFMIPDVPEYTVTKATISHRLFTNRPWDNYNVLTEFQHAYPGNVSGLSVMTMLPKLVFMHGPYLGDARFTINYTQDGAMYATCFTKRVTLPVYTKEELSGEKMNPLEERFIVRAEIQLADKYGGLLDVTAMVREWAGPKHNFYVDTENASVPWTSFLEDLSAQLGMQNTLEAKDVIRFSLWDLDNRAQYVSAYQETIRWPDPSSGN
jgi:hypothetical protein